MNSKPEQPKIQILFAISGKRFTGKDYFTSLLAKELSKININVNILTLANQLKKHYSENFNLDYEKLLSDRAYKEAHREEMTKFYLNTSKTNPLIFCQKALETIKGFKNEKTMNIYILSDLRHKFELEFFKQFLQKIDISLILIRLECSNEIKEKRGWKFIREIDENITEIDLDDYKEWDFIINNNEFGNELLEKFVENKVKPMFFI